MNDKDNATCGPHVARMLVSSGIIVLQVPLSSCGPLVGHMWPLYGITNRKVLVMLHCGTLFDLDCCV